MSRVCRRAVWDFAGRSRRVNGTWSRKTVWMEARFAPQLTFLGTSDDQLSVSFAEFGEGKSFQRNIPVRYIETDSDMARSLLPLFTIC